MNIAEMHTNLDLEIDKSDSLDSIGFEDEEKDYWLNSAIRSFIKNRYSGSGSGEAFEQNQKRIDDLRTLVYEDELTITRGILDNDKPNSYKASLSSTTEIYWFTLSEEVDIAYQSGTTTVASGSLVVDSIYLVSGTGTVTHNTVDYDDGDYFKAVNANWTTDGTNEVFLCTSVRQGITETTADTYRQEVDNPYSEHILENYKAKPLRIFKDTNVELITDGTYGVIAYHLRYLHKPIRVNILEDTSVAATSNVLEGITYVVSGSDIDYNSNPYAPTETFIGVVGVTIFTDTGTATMVIANTDLPDHTNDEVIKLAANMMLENTENPRYQTHTIEVNKAE